MRKKIIYILVVLVSLYLLYLGIIAISRHGKAKVELFVAPSKSTVEINGKKITSSTVYLKPGEYTFKASFDGFDDYITKEKVSQNTEIILTPSANSYKATKYLLNNPDEQRLFNDVGGKAVNQAITTSEKKYGFLSKLPIENRYFTVNSGAPVFAKTKPGEFSIALYVDADSTGGRIEALKSIKSELGIDPTSVEIYFRNSPNSFRERVE